jgi:hypothetical protein
MDFEELNFILEEVETILRRVATGVVPEPEKAMERWRWDEPGTTLTWVDVDNINKNVHALIVEGGSRHVAVEVNAWHDSDEDDGSVRVRRWNHAAIEPLVAVPDKVVADTLEPFHAALSEAFGTAFRKVGTWKGISDLVKIDRVPQPRLT